MKISTEKRNVIIIWVANFLVASSITMIMPFLSLYIDTLGDFSTEYVQKWAGLVFGVTFVTAFIFSPIWGRIGDKYGYKPVLLITGFGISASLFLMGMMTTVYELFVLRFFMGIVTGFIAISTAMIARQTPKKRVGEVLGILQTGQVTGMLFGPLFGGLLADSIGFKFTFIFTSLAIALASTVVIFGVREIRVTEEQKMKQREFTRKEVLSLIFHKKVLITLMLITLLTQVAIMSISPLLAIYVNQLAATNNVAFLAGLAFSATGFGNLMATRKWGRLGDQIGYVKVIMILLISAAIIYIPQAFVTSLWQLVILRLFGVAVGGFFLA